MDIDGFYGYERRLCSDADGDCGDGFAVRRIGADFFAFGVIFILLGGFVSMLVYIETLLWGR